MENQFESVREMKLLANICSISQIGHIEMFNY